MERTDEQALRDGFDRVVESMSSLDGASLGGDYVGTVSQAINATIDNLKQRAADMGNLAPDKLKGYLAEEWHAGTLKIDAARRGLHNVWAETPKSNADGSPDIRYGDSQRSYEAQSKYYATAQQTADQLNDPRYGNQVKLAPSDQADQIDGATDQIKVEKAHSTPLTREQADQMAKDIKDGKFNPDEYGLNTESFVQWMDIARESGKAAAHAALFAATLKAVPHVWREVAALMRTGELDPSRLRAAGSDVIRGAGEAGLRGGIAAGLTAACKAGLLGGNLKQVSPTVIGAATAVAMNVVRYAMQLSRHEIDGAQFADYCLRDTMLVAMGVGGAAIGQALIPVPLLGALIGNLVGTMLGTLIYQGSRSVVLGLCAEHGWTFFGLVKQDYEVPEFVLAEMGFDFVPSGSFSTGSFDEGSFEEGTFAECSLSFTPLRRGVVRANVIGYAA